MTDSIGATAESEFTLRLDLGNVPLKQQQEAVIRALRKVADAIEDYPMTESGQERGGRRSFNALGVVARWVWRA